LAAALAATVLWLVPPRMRMQFDETSLVGSSQTMHEERAALLTAGAVPHRGELVRLEKTVDKRPPLFPFLVSLVHDVSGERPANAFVLNGALLATALLLAFAAARSFGGPVAGVAAFAAPLLLLSVGLTGVVATSAGSELLAGVLLFASVLAAIDFVRAADPVRWSALLGLTLLLAAARQESLFAGGLVLALAAWLARGRWRMDRAAFWLTVLAPTLLAPLGMLLLRAQDPNFYPEAAGRPPLHWSHLFAHTGPFLELAFLDLRGTLSGVLGLVAAAAWAERLAHRRATRLDLLAVVPVLAVTVLTLAWFFSDVGAEPGARRLFLPFCWLAALSPLLLVRGPRTAWTILLLATGLAALRVHDLRSGRAHPTHPIAAVTAALDRLAPQLALEPRTALWVGTPAQYLIVRGHAALCARSFAIRQAEVRQLAAQGDVRTIFVLETPLDAAFAPAFGDPRELLRLRPNEVLLRDPENGITVHRLRP
ncbi:MAG: hypothetical protein WBO45_21340, partial [Planctomycetota bacterium]